MNSISDENMYKKSAGMLCFCLLSSPRIYIIYWVQIDMQYIVHSTEKVYVEFILTVWYWNLWPCHCELRAVVVELQRLGSAELLCGWPISYPLPPLPLGLFE